MDFEKWWRGYIGGDKDKSLVDGRNYAESAWNYQQDRIAELEEKLKREKTALENWINDALKLEAELSNQKEKTDAYFDLANDRFMENQRLREKAQHVCDVAEKARTVREVYTAILKLQAALEKK